MQGGINLQDDHSQHSRTEKKKITARGHCPIEGRCRTELAKSRLINPTSCARTVQRGYGFWGQSAMPLTLDKLPDLTAAPSPMGEEEERCLTGQTQQVKEGTREKFLVGSPAEFTLNGVTVTTIAISIIIFYNKPINLFLTHLVSKNSCRQQTEVLKQMSGQSSGGEDDVDF